MDLIIAQFPADVAPLLQHLHFILNVGPQLGLSQHQAQGTTLALLVPPIGILAVWSYYKQGYVNFEIAGYICVGFLLGSYLGARMATNLPNVVLETIFGVALLLIALKMLLTK